VTLFVWRIVISEDFAQSEVSMEGRPRIPKVATKRKMTSKGRQDIAPMSLEIPFMDC
jgi:hypothetical protein